MIGSLRVRLPTLSRPMLMGLVPLSAILLTAAVAAGAVWVVWRTPAESLLMEQEAAYVAAKQQQALLQTKRKQQELLKTAQRDAEAQRRRLPTQEEFATLAVSISESGHAERVAIPGMTFQVQTREGDLPLKASMQFKATGDYVGIYRFIQRLERMPTYLFIESLDAARASGARVVCNLKVTTFLREDVQPAESS